MDNSDLTPGVEDYLKMILVTQMRLYDVQLTLLLEQNKEVGLELISRHKEFKNISPLPYLEDE